MSGWLMGKINRDTRGQQSRVRGWMGRAVTNSTCADHTSPSRLNDVSTTLRVRCEDEGTIKIANIFSELVASQIPFRPGTMK